MAEKRPIIMLMLLISSALAGAVLGLKFKVLILVPALLFSLLLIASAGIARDAGFGSIVLAMFLSATSLQLGYLAVVTDAVELLILPRPWQQQ
jgi:hypothetical protein